MSERTRKMNCDRKKAYPNKRKAEDAMYGFLRRTVGGMKFNSEAYPCGDHWHWGHYGKPKKRRR